MMGALKEIKVLHIEDDEDHSTLVSKMLNKCERVKFDIIIKGDLQSGILYLNSIDCNIDVVLLDLMLPNSAGVNTFKEVYNVCGTVPVVIISGHEDIAYECIELGAEDYLVKPDISPSLIARSLQYSIERSKNRRLLEKEQKRFKLLSEANFEGVAITKNGIFIDANQQFLDMIGISLDELVGKDVSVYVADKDKELVKNHLETRYEVPYEHMAMKKDGTKFPVEIHGRSLPDGLRLTAVRDMTRYKKAEEDLRISENRYKDLIEVSRAAVYEVDFIHNKFIYVNDFVCEQTGYTREEFLNMSPEDLLTKRSYKDFIDRIESMRKGGYIANEFEYSARTKSGEIVWVVITAAYKEDKDGNIIGAKVIAVDITETKKAKQEANEKEQLIFKELENRIHQWKNELTQSNLIEQEQIRDVKLSLDHMSSSIKSEVF